MSIGSVSGQTWKRKEQLTCQRLSLQTRTVINQRDWPRLHPKSAVCPGQEPVAMYAHPHNQKASSQSTALRTASLHFLDFSEQSERNQHCLPGVRFIDSETGAFL